MPKLLIIEPQLTGHHLTYLEAVLEAVSKAGYETTLATVAAGEGADLASGLRDRFGVRLIGLDSNRVERVWKYALPLREVALLLIYRDVFRVAGGADRVLLPYADPAMYAMALFGPPFRGVKCLGITMRPNFHLRDCGIVAPTSAIARLKKYLFLHLVRRGALELLCIDEFLVSWVRARIPRARISYLADPGEFTERDGEVSIDSQLERLSRCKKILVYGAIDERKGLGNLLSAARNMGQFAVVVAGKVSPSLSRVLRAFPSERLLVLDRRITELEEKRLFADVDLVWVGYSEHYGMSGVLVLAARAGKPVVACRAGLIGWYVARFRLGKAVDPKSTWEIERTLQEFQDGVLSAHSADFQGFLSGRDWRSFSSSLIRALE